MSNGTQKICLNDEMGEDSDCSKKDTGPLGSVSFSYVFYEAHQPPTM